MSIEDILKAAQRANGMPDKPPNKTTSPAVPNKEKSSKKWLIGLLVIIFLMMIGGGEEKKESQKYEIGYLKNGAVFVDEYGKSNYNPTKVKVEIWNQRLVTPEGKELIQIYFLEGDCAYSWGYARENFLSR